MRLHSVIEPARVRLHGLPGAQQCRDQARQLLKEEGGHDRLLELAALQLYENAVRGTSAQSAQPEIPTAPGKSPPFDPTRSLSATAGYTAGLACAAAIGGPLGQSVVQGLADFKPSLLWEPSANLKLFGQPQQIDQVASQLAPRFSLSFSDHEVCVSGSVTPEQRPLVAQALDQLRQRIGAEAFAHLKKVHVRSYLGQLGSHGGPIVGLAYLGTPHAIFVAASQLHSQNAFADTLFHEFGHLRDAQKAGFFSNHYASLSPGSPFGSGGDFDYVSDYARTKPTEDLAETHSHLIQNWDRIQQAPQLWIHANGQLGKKLSWILDKFYDREVPSIGTHLKATLALIDQNQSPFSNREEFQELLQEFLKQYKPDSAQEFSAHDPQRNLQWKFVSELAAKTQNDKPAPSWWRSQLHRLIGD
ncbi:hypothetical protein IV102_23390 [bacterium]|nr:hypothetical protein [bacterium]